jgi:hypothetical protein
VSFLLELHVADLTEEQGRAVEEECRERDTWPVRFTPRRRRRFALFGLPEIGPELWMPDALDSDHHLLSDEAELDVPAWAMQPELLPPLAEPVRVLGEQLPQGFAFRATWVGSEVREERILSADELANLIPGSQINEFTEYRVPPRVSTFGEVPRS